MSDRAQLYVESPSPSRRDDDERRRAHVLLVEDDEGTAESFTWGLRAAQCDVVTVRSGREALDVTRQAAFDLLVIDLRLPDMPGMDVVRQLRAQGIGAPFIIVSGFTTTPIVVEAMKLGASTVLEKPLDLEDLLATVRTVLGRHAPQVALPPRVDTPPARVNLRAAPRSTAGRWAMFVLKVIGSPSDPKTLDNWARAVNVSRSMLAECCRLVHVSPHDARDFARTLRAVYRSEDMWRPEAIMDVADVRTLRKLLGRAGLTDVTHVPDVEEFFTRQTWIPSDNSGLAALRALLRGEDV